MFPSPSGVSISISSVRIFCTKTNGFRCVCQRTCVGVFGAVRSKMWCQYFLLSCASQPASQPASGRLPRHISTATPRRRMQQHSAQGAIGACVCACVFSDVPGVFESHLCVCVYSPSNQWHSNGVCKHCMYFDIRGVFFSTIMLACTLVCTKNPPKCSSP